MFQGLSKRECSVKRKVPSSRRRGREGERGRGEAGGEKREFNPVPMRPEATGATRHDYYGTNSR